MVYRTACSVEPPLKAATKLQMQINIVIDFVVGLIPFIGDIADAAYKCNTKNAVLLEQELRERGQKRIAGTPQAQHPDPSLADEYDYADEEVLNNQHGPPPGYSTREPSRRDRQDRRQHDIEAGRGQQPTRTR